MVSVTGHFTSLSLMFRVCYRETLPPSNRTDTKATVACQLCLNEAAALVGIFMQLPKLTPAETVRKYTVPVSRPDRAPKAMLGGGGGCRCAECPD